MKGLDFINTMMGASLPDDTKKSDGSGGGYGNRPYGGGRNLPNGLAKHNRRVNGFGGGMGIEEH